MRRRCFITWRVHSTDNTLVNEKRTAEANLSQAFLPTVPCSVKSHYYSTAEVKLRQCRCLQKSTALKPVEYCFCHSIVMQCLRCGILYVEEYLYRTPHEARCKGFLFCRRLWALMTSLPSDFFFWTVQSYTTVRNREVDIFYMKRVCVFLP